MDIYELKINLYNFFQRNKNKLVYLALSIFFLSAFFAYRYNKYQNEDLNSYNQLVDFMNGKNEDFLKGNHKNGYKLIKDFYLNSKKPDSAMFKKFAALDDIVFKNLFYFSNNLYFCNTDEYSSYFEAERNPWHNIVKSSNVFCGKKESFKKRPKYLNYFLIGKGFNVKNY